MFLFENSVQAHCKVIRGVQYTVFSHYSDDELIFDRIGSMIENSFTQSDAQQITKSFLLDNGIATGDG